MADDQLYHVKLHDSGSKWISAFYMIAALALFGFLVFTLYSDKFDDKGPYRVDLNQLQNSTTIDIKSRYEIVVREEKPEGVELRLYDPHSGKLLGSFIEQSLKDGSTETASP